MRFRSTALAMLFLAIARPSLAVSRLFLHTSTVSRLSVDLMGSANTCWYSSRFNSRTDRGKRQLGFRSFKKTPLKLMDLGFELLCRH